MSYVEHLSLSILAGCDTTMEGRDVLRQINRNFRPENTEDRDIAQRFFTAAHTISGRMIPETGRTGCVVGLVKSGEGGYAEFHEVGFKGQEEQYIPGDGVKVGTFMVVVLGYRTGSDDKAVGLAAAWKAVLLEQPDIDRIAEKIGGQTLTRYNQLIGRRPQPKFSYVM